MGEKAGSVILAALLAAALLYELWALVNGKPGDTISELVWSWSARYPVVPFLLGFLMGHFFFQRGR